MERTETRHPAGVIGVARDYLARYAEFDMSLHQTQLPAGSDINTQLGVNIAANYNAMIRHTLSQPAWQWLWILGDDHIWTHGLLMDLLDHDVDIVIPFVLRRNKPFRTVIHTSAAEGYRNLIDNELDGHTGLVDITACTFGNAGMLVRRRVLETMTDPWFENGKTKSDTGGCDLYFSEKARVAGFSMYLDLDSRMGHLTTVSVNAWRDEQGRYRPEIMTPCGEQIQVIPDKEKDMILTAKERKIIEDLRGGATNEI